MKIKETIKKIAIVLMIAAFTFAMTACGGSDDGSGGSDGSGNSGSSPKFDFGDIEWSVESGKNDGYDVVRFGYVNNSEYDISGFHLDFKLKDDVTEDDVNGYEELKKKAKDMEEEPTELTISANTTKYVPAGEEFKNGICNLDGTVQYFTDYDAYELFEPETMTIEYISGNKIHTAYYDYEKQKVSYDEPETAYKWSDSELAKKLPKPETKIVVPGFDDEDSFSADIYCADEDVYNNYIDACKEKGFDKNIDTNNEWMWDAENKEGDKLSLIFQEEDDHLSVHLDKGEK